MGEHEQLLGSLSLQTVPPQSCHCAWLMVSMYKSSALLQSWYVIRNIPLQPQGEGGLSLGKDFGAEGVWLEVCQCEAAWSSVPQ